MEVTVGDIRGGITGTLVSGVTAVELVSPSESATTDDAVTVVIAGDKRGTTGDDPTGVGDDAGLLVSTPVVPPTSAWGEFEATAEVLELVQAVLDEDAEEDGSQLVLEVEADSDQQDTVDIAPVLTDAIDDVVAVKTNIESWDHGDGNMYLPSNAEMLLAWCKRRRLGTAADRVRQSLSRWSFGGCIP
jgi:hypothetical protein